MILWSKIMLALIQGLRGIYFKNKTMATLMLKDHQCHIHIWVALMIPHSYLVRFELIQTCCLLSMLCTFFALIIHVHNIKHYLSVMTIIQKLAIPLKEKENRKWVIMLMVPCSEKKREKTGRWQCILELECIWQGFNKNICGMLNNRENLERYPILHWTNDVAIVVSFS